MLPSVRVPPHINGRRSKSCYRCRMCLPQHQGVNMNEWLDDRSKVEKAIVGAICTAVAAHGVITIENAPSAAKRVYAVLKRLRREATGGSDENHSGPVYAIGALDESTGGYGMWFGPTPDLQRCLDEIGRPGDAIFRFDKGDDHDTDEIIRKWSDRRWAGV